MPPPAFQHLGLSHWGDATVAGRSPKNVIVRSAVFANVPRKKRALRPEGTPPNPPGPRARRSFRGGLCGGGPGWGETSSRQLKNRNLNTLRRSYESSRGAEGPPLVERSPVLKGVPFILPIPSRKSARSQPRSLSGAPRSQGPGVPGVPAGRNMRPGPGAGRWETFPVYRG